MNDDLEPPDEGELGTTWTEPGAGDDLATLRDVFDDHPIRPGDETRGTDLRLTGRPIQDHDHWRFRHITVGARGSFQPAK